MERFREDRVGESSTEEEELEMEVFGERRGDVGLLRE